MTFEELFKRREDETTPSKLRIGLSTIEVLLENMPENRDSKYYYFNLIEGALWGLEMTSYISEEEKEQLKEELKNIIFKNTKIK